MTKRDDRYEALDCAGKPRRYVALHKLASPAEMSRLPYSLRILLENVVRGAETPDDREASAILGWDPAAEPADEVAFRPARVILQDFTGVPCVVDLAAMRDAMADLGGDPERINPLVPVELVIDHSVQVDRYGTPESLRQNVEREYERNGERYAFLKWGQRAFRNMKVVPPSTGIVHQVNIEHLARVVFDTSDGMLYPDTVVGTDSHTTMVNGLGVLGWGVGGIEAEAAMLGQPISMLVPRVVAVRMEGALPAGSTATDLVLTITQMLRAHGVVGQFVEYIGPGAASLSLADRATIANMAPEYGATCGFFPVDSETLRYLRNTGRDEAHIAIVEAYLRAQGLFWTEDAPEPEYSAVLRLDLSTIVPSVAGPRRPQDRVPLDQVASSFATALPGLRKGGADAVPHQNPIGLDDGDIAIAAITSCTNTSNPSVMVAAGLLARNAASRGLKPRPWVKASLAPGSRVVTEYLQGAGLLEPLAEVGFYVVGYGCTTCIGNSGPLPEEVAAAIDQDSLVVASVLSGNRNFEGRVQQDVRANYLMSPPLVVAYALAGSVTVNLLTEPLGQGADGTPIFLRDIWPSEEEVAQVVAQQVTDGLYRSQYAEVYEGGEEWRAVPETASARYAWNPASTYVKKPPYFDGLTAEPDARVNDLVGARALLVLGDSITTDHISPAGSIRRDSPAGAWLTDHGIAPSEFNSYGSRRGHDAVMVRGTFANVRIRNRLALGAEGGVTTHLPTGDVLSVYEAAERYAASGTPLIVLAGKEYGSGSSRDWAAKGPYLLGVRAALAETYERIHRSNLVGMGIAPLEYEGEDTAERLGLTGEERFDITGLEEALGSVGSSKPRVRVRAVSADGRECVFQARLRIDTPREADYYRHGGILQYVLRQLRNEERP